MARSNTIRVVPFARLQSILITPFGIIAGIVYSLGGAIYELATSSLNSGTALAFLALIGMPLMFAAFGFVLGLIEALLFNVFARWFGGIEIDFGC